jgi:hypothetical protein
MTPSRHLWSVRYRRADWRYAQVRRFMSELFARRLIDKLTRSARRYRHLSPLVELTLICQTLGPEEVVLSFEPWVEKGLG